jgi:Rod binding domain-containing protein
MTALSLVTPQIDATAAPAAATAAELARRGQIHATAQKFEASFLTSVLQTMFQSLPTAPPFGGGAGEDMWKSFLAEAMAKDMARRGGVGVAHSVEREMLRLQGLGDSGAAPAAEGQASAGKPGAAEPEDMTTTAKTATPYGAAPWATLQSAPRKVTVQ